MLSTTELIQEWHRIAVNEESHYGCIKDPTYCGITLPNEGAREISKWKIFLKKR
ncbi:hypothetical protein P4V86_03570 [Brevibacillus laterosporus]|uniref:hypothetical protein n=1 Tax=Brevibacillus laterosporus TaxID=1465 RepID=UPI00037088DD|nr:hypothetical protein [Brevibacillus laterosporus]MED2002438.1 hypothetical protein [Brevibacillus laterosporus]